MAMPRASMARISANASKAIGCFSAAPEPAGEAQARFARPWRHLADHVRLRHAEQAQRIPCGSEGVDHAALAGVEELQQAAPVRLPFACQVEDRKSTRLNSSHVKISYAVFCLKKKIIRRDIVK